MCPLTSVTPRLAPAGSEVSSPSQVPRAPPLSGPLAHPPPPHRPSRGASQGLRNTLVREPSAPEMSSGKSWCKLCLPGKALLRQKPSRDRGSASHAPLPQPESSLPQPETGALESPTGDSGNRITLQEAAPSASATRHLALGSQPWVSET